MISQYVLSCPASFHIVLYQWDLTMLLHVAVVFLFHCLKRVPVTPKKSPQTSVTSMAQHLFSWQICSLAMLVPASFGFKQGCLKAGPSIVWSFAYMSGGWWQNTFMWPEHAHYMVAGLQGQASHLHVVRRGGVESTWARQTLYYFLGLGPEASVILLLLKSVLWGSREPAWV